MGALLIPWTTPTILSGFLLGGSHGAIVQVLGLVASTLIYLPFLKMQDNECLEEEMEEGDDLEDETLI